MDGEEEYKINKKAELELSFLCSSASGQVEVEVESVGNFKEGRGRLRERIEIDFVVVGK